MARVAIVGAAGYTGAELTRLLGGHPSLELVMVTSSADAGKGVADVYPALAGIDLEYVEPDVGAVAEVAEVAFLAVPHTKAMSLVPTLLGCGTTVIDLSADFRLRDPGVYAHWYGVRHVAPGLLAQAVYGLPELDRSSLAGARLVACPGCYPTAALLATAPALEAGVASGPVVVDAKSGVSGAGRGAIPTTHHCSAAESLAPYGVGTHRHTPEIAAGMETAAGQPVPLTFVPHLAPMKRGILATAYLQAADGLTVEKAHAVYAERFVDEPFVTVHEPPRMPATAEVSGSNRAHLGIALDENSGMLVVACAIDNLVKGASGQAVQCANLVLGLDETAGLDAIAPVV